MPHIPPLFYNDWSASRRFLVFLLCDQIWLVVAASERFQLQTMTYLTIYLKRPGDSMADCSAETLKPLATPLFISCEIRRFNDDMNHLSLADFSVGNQTLITGKCWAIKDEVISKTCADIVLLVCTFLCWRHPEWLSTLKMSGHHWPYLQQFLLGDSVMTQSV